MFYHDKVTGTSPQNRGTLQNSKFSLEVFSKVCFDLGINLQVFPKIWPRLVRLVRLVLRHTQHWKMVKDLHLDLHSTDIVLEFGRGEIIKLMQCV